MRRYAPAGLTSRALPFASLRTLPFCIAPDNLPQCRFVIFELLSSSARRIAFRRSYGKRLQNDGLQPGHIDGNGHEHDEFA